MCVFLFLLGLIARTLIDGIVRKVTAVRKDQQLKVEAKESELRGAEGEDGAASGVDGGDDAADGGED